MPHFSAVVCVDKNNGIGKSGSGLLWHNPNGLRHFKELTIGHPIVMGRKTWETIGRPLPERQNIIMTRNPDFCVDGGIVVHSTREVENLSLSDDEIMVIGGLEIWNEFWLYFDTIYMSKLSESYSECNLFFPDISTRFRLESERLEIGFVFQTYRLTKDCIFGN